MGILLIVGTILIDCFGFAILYWVGDTLTTILIIPMIHRGAKFSLWHIQDILPYCSIQLPFLPHPLSTLGLFCIGIVILFYLRYAWHVILQRHLLALKLAKPTQEQQAKIAQVYQQLQGATDDVAIKLPKTCWYQPGATSRHITWVGCRLIIGDTLLHDGQEDYLLPLLLHAIEQFNSSDVRLRAAIALLPPLAPGRLCLFLFWSAYWRHRVFVADRFVAYVGFKDALIETIELLVSPLEQPKNRLLREEPYVAERIARLRAYQP